MDEKFIEAIGGSVDAGFVSLLRKAKEEKKEAKLSYVKVKQTKSRRRVLAKGGYTGFVKSPKRKGGLRGGEITWIEHVRLTAGGGMCWKDAMIKASQTWRR